METKPTNRITSLDLLRGFALLGILIMNIISFSNVGVGYINPTLGAGLDGYNGWIHGFSHLFADMRFMSLFSILFGAGVLLFSDRIEKKELSASKYHYKRMFWLFVFGMMHAYLIWMGDILVSYAICGSIVFLLRKKSLKTLYIIGGISFVVPTLFSMMTYFFTPQAELQEIFAFWTPSTEELTTEITAYTGSYIDQMTPRSAGAFELQTFLFLIETMWRVIAMMLLGMILYRTGILTASRNRSSYSRLAFIGLSLGLVISAMGLYRSYELDWEGIWSMNVGHHYTYIASLCMALGYIGVIMLWDKSSFLPGLQARFRAVGRMAFTNYILMSLICTFIYYGHGLGLLGTMDRLETSFVVLGIWVFLLAYSLPFIKRFNQGPLERLWRKLSYGKEYSTK